MCVHVSNVVLLLVGVSEFLELQTNRWMECYQLYPQYVVVWNSQSLRTYSGTQSPHYMIYYCTNMYVGTDKVASIGRFQQTLLKRFHCTQKAQDVPI